MRLLLLVLLGMILFATDGAAALPDNIDGVRLGWPASRAIKFLKKRKWGIVSNTKNGCRRSIIFRNLPGDAFTISIYRNRVIQVSKILGPGNSVKYNARRWQTRLRRLRRKYGKPKMKMIPMGNVYVIFCRWVNRKRWFSMSGNMTRSRPFIIKMVISNIKDQRGQRQADRCSRRR